MKYTLPTGLTHRDFEAALSAFANAIGSDWVLTTETDINNYQDFYAFTDTPHIAAAAIAPLTTEEVQAVVRIANDYKIPLWPIGRGKNFGYGSAAPVMQGCVILDLTRMKKIEIDEENGTALVEPGVGFYDLYDYIESHRLPYWISAPGNSWGSVVGNALDRGVGYTPYGDHAARIHGLEVVLPNGELLRTGMGAMAGSKTWNLHPYGFGPNWDQMFVQSNFGVVTKMGIWLMPEPESMVTLKMQLPKPEDLGWAIDTLAPMRREGLIQQSPSIGNWLRTIAARGVRSEWYDKPGPFPDSVIQQICQKLNIGWWAVDVRLYGREGMTKVGKELVKQEFAKRTKYEMTEHTWTQGQPRSQSPASGIPITFPLQNAAWHGGRGGHVSFSPVLEQSGAVAMQQFKRTYQLYNDYEMDYHPAFNLGERHMTNINQIMFNKDDPAMVARVDKFFRALVDDATRERYGEYRSHIDYMDLIASTYDFNNNAQTRLNEQLKNAIDPNGIIAPGKSGIWPTRFKGEKLS